VRKEVVISNGTAPLRFSGSRANKGGGREGENGGRKSSGTVQKRRERKLLAARKRAIGKKGEKVAKHNPFKYRIQKSRKPRKPNERGSTRGRKKPQRKEKRKKGSSLGRKKRRTWGIYAMDKLPAESNILGRSKYNSGFKSRKGV